MISDYTFVRSSRLKLSHLYIANDSSNYWFYHGEILDVAFLHVCSADQRRRVSLGLNLRAPVIWALAIFPSFPGFLSTVSKGKIAVPIGWVHTSYLAWILGASPADARHAMQGEPPADHISLHPTRFRHQLRPLGHFQQVLASARRRGDRRRL